MFRSLNEKIKMPTFHVLVYTPNMPDFNNYCAHVTKKKASKENTTNQDYKYDFRYTKH